MTLPNAEFQSVGRRIATLKRPVLFTHGRADGDAIGSLIAMRSIFRALGADPRPVLFEPPSDKYAWLVADDPIAILNSDSHANNRSPHRPKIPAGAVTTTLNDLSDTDGVLVLDTCAFAQLAPVADWLRSLRTAGEPSITAIDHHVTRDDVADTFLVDESAAANCLIIYEWANACGWRLDDDGCRGLFTGIATDTGWFRFSSTDARTLTAAAQLVDRGVNPQQLYDRLFESESVARVKMFGAAINAMELHENDTIAILPVSRIMFESLGAVPADTEDLVNHALRIDSVRVAALVADLGGEPKHLIKISFRSKGEVDVAALATQFDGGGHKRAAGARMFDTLENAKSKILTALRAATRQSIV